MSREPWRHSPAAWLRSMSAGVGRARTLGLAAEMAFWLFLSIVPLAAVAGFVGARLATSNETLAITVLSAVPPQVRELFARQLHRIAAWQGGAVAPLAAATFLWLASSGIHSIFDGLEVQSGTERPWWKKRLLALGACVALAFGVALVALLGAGLDWMQSLAGRTLPTWMLQAEHGTAGRAVRWGLAALIAIGMEAGLYRLAIPRPLHKHFPVFPGAVLAVALQALLGWGYGFYVAKLGGGDAYLAGLAAVGITMMTLWLFSVSLLLGAQLNRVLAERLRGNLAWPPRSSESSSPPTSRRPPSTPSTGPSTLRQRSAPPSP